MRHPATANRFLFGLNSGLSRTQQHEIGKYLRKVRPGNPTSRRGIQFGGSEVNLSESVQQYILKKRSEGIFYETGANFLLAFQRQVGDLRLSEITATHVLTYLNDRQVCNSTWRSKHFQLAGLFEFWSVRGHMRPFLMPPMKPRQRNMFIPYVYTRAQLRALLTTIRKNRTSERTMDWQTLRTVLLFLYGSGAGVGETLRLNMDEVDLKRRTVRLGGRRCGPARYIPIGKDLLEALQQYSSWRSRMRYECSAFFVAKGDRPINIDMLRHSFDRIRQSADVTRTDGGKYQPRLCDLKVTFAVHRITSWIKNDADLNRMLPALAAYMGQVGLGHTERYLSLTPERFHKDLNKLSPGRPNGRWRNNKSLMEFIAAL